MPARPMSENEMPNLGVVDVDRWQFNPLNNPQVAHLGRPHPEGQTKSAFKPGEVRRLLENSPGFLAVVRGNTLTFELVNRAFADLVGTRELIGKPAKEILPGLGSSFF